jgi:hypothetical protein
VLTVGLLVVLVASGCGGSSSTAATNIAKTSFGTDADAICKRLGATFAAQKLPKISLAVIAHISSARAVLEKGAVGELERLTAPTSAKSSWLEMLSAKRTLAHELSRLGRAAKSGDQKLVNQLGVSKKAHHALMTAAASKLGLTDCASVG